MVRQAIQSVRVMFDNDTRRDYFHRDSPSANTSFTACSRISFMWPALGLRFMALSASSILGNVGLHFCQPTSFIAVVVL